MNFVVNKNVIACYLCGRSGHIKITYYKSDGFLSKMVRVLNIMEARKFALIVEETATLFRLCY